MKRRVLLSAPPFEIITMALSINYLWKAVKYNPSLYLEAY